MSLLCTDMPAFTSKFIMRIMNATFPYGFQSHAAIKNDCSDEGGSASKIMRNALCSVTLRIGPRLFCSALHAPSQHLGGSLRDVEGGPGEALIGVESRWFDDYIWRLALCKVGSRRKAIKEWMGRVD